MKLTQLDTISACEKGMSVTIRDADGVETDIRVHIVGVDSAIYRDESRRIDARKQLATKRGKELDGDDLEEAYIGLLAACTTGWDKLEADATLAADLGGELDGEQLKFSREVARALYRRFPLIKGQVFAALLDRAAFLGNASEPSSTSSKPKRG
ncbi:hypothetical protein [Parachitinimonas caeni]|uniref:Tail assembly chaperone n=1 Tax=Parachitinimonas caeni TaxID=3031301 RepID=A0ABT7DRA0_9NEIS|nr:hypothetical protein [Parachitinimonas caeni]MDK2122602.1 hypothetical protein [Parachitinimonas caeni]